MEGRLFESLNAAKLLDGNVGPALKEMPMLEGFMTVTPLIYVRFNRWDDIQKSCQPDPSVWLTNAVCISRAAWLTHLTANRPGRRTASGFANSRKVDSWRYHFRIESTVQP